MTFRRSHRPGALLRALGAGAGLSALIVLAGGVLRTEAAPTVPQQSREEWYVDYDYALRAIDRADWERAIQLLELAISKNPRSSQNARTYGMRFITYVPYFYLGVSHYNLRDTAAAQRYFRQERAAGQITRSRELAQQLAVLEAAAAGPTGPAGAIASANAAQRARLDSAVALGTAALERAQYRQAFVTFSAVLAVDPTHAGARALRDSTRRRALAGELDDIVVRARGAGNDSTGGTTPRSEAAIFESKAWELVRRGKDLLERGFPDSALTKLDFALHLASELPNVTQLKAEAQRHRRAAEGEVARLAEARRQLEIAAANPAAAVGKPQVTIVTPVALEDEVSTELVTLQGTAIHPGGIARLEIVVNGASSSDVVAGRRTRGIVPPAVTANPSDGLTRVRAQDAKGTIVDFHRDVALTQPVNRIAIRAHAANGEVMEAVRVVRRSSSTPKVWAAIVGVARYKQPGVPPLGYTVADAQAFATYLTQNLGVPKDQIFTLYDDEATTPRIRTLLGTELRKRAAKGDLVLIYFAGHGAPEADAVNRDGDGFEKYLLSIESALDDLYGTALSMNAVGEVFDRIPADRLVFIADACYSGAAGGNARTITARAPAAVSDRFLDRVASVGKGRVVLAASSANELSQERSDLGHGVFTYYFLEALRGAGDVNKDGLVTLEEAYRHVSLRVPEATGRLQHPVLKGDASGDLVLGRVAGTK